MRVERGATVSHQNLPAPLLEAEAILSKYAPGHRDDPKWMQSQARAALLEWDYDTAIRKIDDALILKPDDPELLVDRAIALYERGTANQPNGSFVLGEAVNELGKVLKKAPANTIALFNRAILYEALFLPDEAIADLDNYLVLDPSGPWAEEAAIRLSRLTPTVKSHEEARKRPLASSKNFVELSNQTAGVPELDERIEDYLDVAISEWLPQAFPAGSKGSGDPATFEALRALGKMLSAKHDDTWVSDLLVSASSRQAFAQAARSLQIAVTMSAHGEANHAVAEAKKAGRLFLVAHSDPGALRASVEKVHALRNAQRGSECLAEANQLSERLRNTNYRWMRTQLAIDKSSCLLMEGEFEQARAELSLALEGSKKSVYPVLQLRSLGIAASVESDKGNLLEAWEKNENGLAGYWRNTFSPPRRAQQFYDDLSYAAENTGELNLAFSLAQESVLMSILAKDRTLQAMTRGHLAQIAIRTGDLPGAERELQSSADILTSIANQPGMEAFRVAAESGLAGIESQRGEFLIAEERLRKIRPEVKGLESFDVTRAYYKAEAAVLMKEGKLDLAENALRLTIAQADQYLLGLTDEHSRYLWIEENASLYRSLVGLELAKGDKLTALTVWEWYRAALSGYRSTRYKSFESLLHSTIIADSIAAMHEKTLISYALVPQGLAVWVIDDRGINSAIVSADDATLRFLVMRFSEMCADPSSDPLRLQQAGRKLFEILLGPVFGRMGSRRVLNIEPDYLFDDISFAALVTPDGRYFGEKNVITISSGLLYSNKQRPGREFSAATRALFVGSLASAAAGLSSGPPIDVDDEVEEISALFSAPRVLKGYATTIPAVEQAIPGSELLHFAGHALADGNREGLVMFADGPRSKVAVWDADQVKQRSLRRCRLVVLSACSTGKGYRGRNQKRGTLTRSFLVKGVPDVVASHWDVDSLTTSHFMNIFYKALLSGQTVALSLHTAAAALRTQPATAHPYYWAAFSEFERQ